MCGIVAVISQSDDRPPIAPELLAPVLAQATNELREITKPVAQMPLLRSAAEMTRSVDQRLRSLPGVHRLVNDPQTKAAVSSAVTALAEQLARIDALLDAPPSQAAEAVTETTDLAGRLADSVFAIARDRLRTASAIVALSSSAAQSDRKAGALLTSSCVTGLWAIQVALSSLDRLEVRGRDSAGLQVFVADKKSTAEANGTPFVYKVAAEIGELGDNTAALREQISSDQKLHTALNTAGTTVSVLAHTRWASVGIISEPNAHPLDGFEHGAAEHTTAEHNASVHCAAVLNGDVDNYTDLKESNNLQIAPEVTTDAKVIPTLLRRALLTDNTNSVIASTQVRSAFSSTVNDLEGSVAIAAHTQAAPRCLMLALRGSGQALYVGANDNAYIVASEPYGLVEEVDHYLRMNGEASADRNNPVGSRGQIILLDPDNLTGLTNLTNRTEQNPEALARLQAVDRYSFDNSQLPVAKDEITTAEITTRDIDRGDAPHFFLKEIREAPRSFRTTLRGRIEHYRSNSFNQHARVVLEDSALPANVREALNTGRIKNIVAIGQGTAAIAAAALPFFCDHADLHPAFPKVSAELATELSGFGLTSDMSDTLVVAVSQSGTTTDLNRTVELVRARGALVLAIVNRRNSDLTERADGVLYTSDGRDVEMSVASTKAFYAQVAAIVLLSVAISSEFRSAGNSDRSGASTLSAAHEEFTTDLLNALEAMPAAIEEVLASRAEIALIARRHVGFKRHWAVVGNGVNHVAAREIRIKLSELCYHAVAEDFTENKKHIDLSSEPLILVCAAGVPSSVDADIAKEIEIYRAHRSTPVVFASKTSQFAGEPDVVTVPQVHRALDFVLAAVAGHLFSYEAARVIDSLADPLREMRVAVEAAVGRYMAPENAATVPTSSTGDLLAGVAEDITAPANRLLSALQAGSYDGHLRVGTALRLTSVLPFVQGVTGLELYQQTLGKVGTPGTVLEDLERVLNTAIDELTRPVDTIKHQAKSVTVGISRSEDSLLASLLVTQVQEAGAPRDRLSYASLQTLAALDPAVKEVVGYTRYRIDGEITADSGALHETAIDLTRPAATIQVVDRGGVACEITSRTGTDSRLRGTKHRAAFEREVTVGRGSDGRTVIHVPETKDGRVVGLTLLHCQFASTIRAHQMRAVLRGYRGRYGALVDAVTEALPVFKDDVLGQIDVVDLLTRPVYVLAESWITPSTGDTTPTNNSD